MALAAVAAPQAAGASIISYLGPSVTDSSGSPIYFDALTGSIDTSPTTGDYELLVDNAGTLARLAVFDGTLLNPGSLRKFAVSAVDFSNSSQASSAARLPFGDSVAGRVFKSFLGTLAEQSVHLSSHSAFSGHFGHFNSTGGDVSGYLGLEVLQGSTPEYGWADIVVHPNFTVTLDSFALDTSGGSLTTGETGVAPTPEPASILLLALGAAGIAAYRRKRKA
jgi:hypothetical protein